MKGNVATTNASKRSCSVMATTIVVTIMTNGTAHAPIISSNVKTVVVFQFIGVAMAIRIAPQALMKLVVVSRLNTAFPP